MVQPTWIQKIISSYDEDSEAKEKIANAIVTPDNNNYSRFRGLLHYKGKLYVGTDTDLRHQILAALHNSALGGHSGI